MKYSIKYGSSYPNILGLSKLALKHRLFVSGWNLNGILHYPNEIQSIVIAEINTTPVGVAIICQHNHIMVFVRKKHRRQNIGTALVKKICSKHPTKLTTVFVGNRKTDQFREVFWSNNEHTRDSSRVY